jgi:CRP/FNR family transcriptional regulator, cyclic AMP receptor protein
MSERQNFLKQADIFYQLTPAQLDMIANICQERTFDQGDIILEEGASTNELYIIAQGEVDILINPAIVGGQDTQKSEVMITTLQRGQSFGEIALVDEGIRSATARAAQKDTRLLIIPRDKLVMLCNTYPQFGYRLMYNLAADLAMKIRNADLRVREQLLYVRKK